MIDLKEESGIYKITSPSNRIYIGQSKNIKKRYLSYKYGKCSGQPKLKSSFNKYGFENHKFEIIETCIYLDLNIKERYWQDYYNATDKNNLNCLLTKTDELPKIYSEETLKNLKDKYIDYLLLKKQCICQYDLEGNFIKEWDNITQLRLEIFNFDTNKIRRALNSQNSPYQYLNSFWRYDYSISEKFIKDFKEQKIKKENLKIIQYSLKGEFIKEWKCQENIIKELKIYPVGNLKGKQSHASGYIWKYKSEPITQNDIDKIIQKPNSYVKIYQYSLGGDFIKLWKSKREVKNILGYVVGGAVYNEVNSKGFVWSKTLLTREEVLYKAFNKSLLKCKPIIQYNLDGTFVKEWQSAKEIYRATKLQLNRYLDKKEKVIKNNYLWTYKQ